MTCWQCCHARTTRCTNHAHLIALGFLCVCRARGGRLLLLLRLLALQLLQQLLRAAAALAALQHLRLRLCKPGRRAAELWQCEVQPLEIFLVIHQAADEHVTVHLAGMTRWPQQGRGGRQRQQGHGSGCSRAAAA